MKHLLNVKLDLDGMPADEQERFVTAMAKVREAMAQSISSEVEEFIQTMVKRRFNEVFLLGLSSGVALACGVVVIAHWVSTT